MACLMEYQIEMIVLVPILFPQPAKGIVILQQTAALLPYGQWQRPSSIPS